MNNLRYILLLILTVNTFNIKAQDTRVITTAVPFLMISPDARAAGMGDMGVATAPDTYSQNWNASKYAFAKDQIGFGMSYTPYLSSLVNDIFLGDITYYNRLNDRSAYGISLKYFSLGDIDLTTAYGQAIGTERPNELTIDGSYSLRLGERFALGVGMRYLRSDLKISGVPGSEDVRSGNSFAVDISGYYQSEELALANFDGRIRAGFALTNMGPKMKYTDVAEGDFLPTNLRLGGGFDFLLDEYNKVGVTVEFNKLLVPTPPILDGSGAIIAGKDDKVGWMSGMFQSFGDAPGGGSEEMKEITYALGAEYLYNDSFAFRAGYFHENEIKGARKYFTLGAGFKYNVVKVDLSYLFSTSAVANNPLDNTLRFSISFNLGEQYDEY
jgi:hypothetical protein